MDATPAPRLKNFPISWFAMIMGMTGLTIAWSRAELLFDLGTSLSSVLLLLTSTLAVTLAAAALAKLIKYPDNVLAEIQHPVKIAFVPTISISLILLSIAFLHVSRTASFWLWCIGTAMHLVLTLYVLASWIQHSRYEIAHLNPAWFIPVVGNILVPIAGIHHASTEISWFFFSLGLFFWPVLTSILFYRLIFHASLPERFVPTLFIFIAPPAVGFLSYYNLVGGLDAFARILYGVALFFTMLVLVQARYFIHLKFYLSWWAYSFPLAAVTLATLVMARETRLDFYLWLGGGLLAMLSLIIALLLARTAIAVAHREICVEGH